MRASRTDLRDALRPGWERWAAATRRALDELAREKGLDPEEIRREAREEIRRWEEARR